MEQCFAGKKRLLGRVTAALLLVAGVGCAHQRNNFAQELAQVQYPGWVLRGSGPAKVGEGRYFFGVGQVTGMRNVALARSTADNRARAELVKSFELFAASVLAVYAREQSAQDDGSNDVGTEAGAGGSVTLVARPAEVSSEQLVKTLAACAVSNVAVAEHWFHPDDGAVFSLARLDLSQLSESIARQREFRPSLRGWLQAHLTAQHDAMCEQRQRRGVADEAGPAT